MQAKLTFLGTGNAFGHDSRRRSHYFFEGALNVLIDASYDALPGLRSIGKSIADVDMICLSHLHPDHYMALPQFSLENYYVIQRVNPIPVVGPVGSEETIKQATVALFDDVIVDHLDNLYKFYEITHNKNLPFAQIDEISEVSGSIQTLEASHSGNARMQIIEIDGKTIGYTGDTEFVPDVFDKLLQSDIVITEASSASNVIPGHTRLDTLLSQNFSNSPPIYISHVGNSVVEERDNVKEPFILAEDGLTIEF